MLSRFPGIKPPPVAVVIGCYDQASYVEAAIRSVAAQTYADFECVVLDNGSADGSPNRIQDVLGSLGDPRFRVIMRRDNGGQMTMMLEGFDATSAPFVAFLDADDMWHPAFLESHVQAHLSACGVAAVSCSNLAVVSAEGIQLSGGMPNFIGSDPRQPHRNFTVTEEVLDAEARTFVAAGVPSTWIWSATSAMMFRRSVLELLRPARPERLRICADHYIARGAHMLGGTVRIEQSLGCYRLHDSNEFARNELLGSRTALGRPPREIVIASDEEFVRCLCDRAEQLRATLPPGYVAKLLLEYLGTKGAIALAESNAGAKLILSEMPPPPPETRLRKTRRRLAKWLNPKTKTPKIPGRQG